MPPMPVEIKLLTLVIVLALAGLIVVYHVWLDRRLAAGEPAAPPRPAPVQPESRPRTPPPASAGGQSVSRTAPRMRRARAPVRRLR